MKALPKTLSGVSAAALRTPRNPVQTKAVQASLKKLTAPTARATRLSALKTRQPLVLSVGQSQYKKLKGLSANRAVASAKAGSGEFCCFVAGTLVTTDKGLKPIEQIGLGEMVLSRDETTGQMAFKPVTALIPGHDREIYILTVETVSASGERKTSEFETTNDHPWRMATGSWAETDDLVSGQMVQTATLAEARVVSVKNTGRTSKTYNIEVADFHTYFVGNEQLWVHNACWSAGSFKTLSDSLVYHYKKHGAAVGAKDIKEYAQMATNFSKKIDQLSSSGVRDDGSTKYSDASKFIIMRDGKIVSFGAK